jgi:class II lanthipeptide synthase
MCCDRSFLEAAASIARRIASEAIWYDGRCSWVGAVDEPTVPQRDELRALGPDVYGGTAGVGLFLARIAAVTGELALRRTAGGALRHATERAHELPKSQRDGFHAGSLGVAWAAAEAAAVLDDAELHAAARGVASHARPPSAADRCPDLVMGSAGSIAALLALADALDDARLADEAVACGDDLVERAAIGRHGWSWALPGRRYRHHLCGVSHGAAGIGWALVELFRATGEERFRSGAMGAFAYERSWLDPESGTWPDLRLGGHRRGVAATIAQPGRGTWCHGEPGIALARQRATAVLGPGPHDADAQTAIAATVRHVSSSLAFAIDDLSLCHGLGGAADVLMSAGADDIASEIGRVAIERYADGDHDWPGGTAGGTTPGLFRGLSGIGWFFLRLHDRMIPSPLALPMCR